MKIPPETMAEAIRDFKKFGTLTYPLLVRRLKVSQEMAEEICKEMEKKFPRMWANRNENQKKKWIEGLNG
jgi:hypothetical protein